MADIHIPTNRQAKGVFLAMLALAAVLFMWSAFFNKGALTVNGEAPFSIIIAGRTEKVCDSSPCEISLRPRTHAVIFRKGGFFDTSAAIPISRWKNNTFDVTFEFIPIIKGAAFRPPFLGLERPENIPRDAKEILFSSSGQQALVKLGKEWYLYDVAKKALYQSEIGTRDIPGWSGDRIIILETDGEKQLLKILDGKKRTLAANFSRSFKNPKLLGSADGNTAVILEIDNGKSSWYLVDLEKKSRRKLAIPESARNSRILKSTLLYEDGAEGQIKVYALHLKNFSVWELPTASPEHVAEKNDGVFWLISENKGDTERQDITVTEALEQAKKETFVLKSTSSKRYLLEWRALDKKAKVIGEFTLKEGETVKKLEEDIKNGKLYFVKGNSVFEVIFE